MLNRIKHWDAHRIDVNELPDYKLIGKLLLEETIKYPGDIVVLENKNYITVEKVNQYYFDGVKYQFAKTKLIVKALDNFY